MIPLPSLDMLLVQAFAVLLAWAAVSDLQRFIIPNRISLSIALLYPAYVLAAPQPVDWLLALLIAAVVFAVGAFAFARGWFGGGDVKLFTVAALWAGPALAPSLLLTTGLTGALMGVLALARPLFARIGVGWLPAVPVSGERAGPAASGSNAPAEAKPTLRTNIPYGVAIAVGGLAVAMQILAR